MSYWSATDDYLRAHGAPPTCPSCGKEMFPEDDHGRFTCFCNFAKPGPTIPQVNVSGMSDEEKSKIPPIHRLNATPTAAEAKFMALAAKGPDALDDPEYEKARKAVGDERKE